MDANTYLDIINIFSSAVDTKDRSVVAYPYSRYFTKQGTKNKNMKYYKIFINLKSLRKIDSAYNMKLIGHTLVQCSECIDIIIKKYDNIIFDHSIYNDESCRIELRYCPVDEEALRQLNSSGRHNSYKTKC